MKINSAQLSCCLFSVVLGGRQDAYYGVTLIGNGEGDFSALTHSESGFFVEGQVRTSQPIRINNNSGTCLLQEITTDR